MKCPKCSSRLRNKTENGIKYRYCKGCDWQKAVQDRFEIEDEIAEIDQKIKAPSVTLNPPIEVPKLPFEIAELSEWTRETNKRIEAAIGIPAEMIIVTETEKTEPTTATEITTLARGTVVVTTVDVGEPQPENPEAIKKWIESQAKPVEGTSEPVEKPKKGFFRKLFGK